MDSNPNNGRSLAAIIAEMKEELKEFVQTRSRMLKAEVQEKFTALKIAAPLAGVGALLLGTAYLLFTMALVALVAALFRDNPYRWCFAFAAIAVLWGLLGGIAAYLAKREFQLKGLLPKRTLELLKGDKLWLQAEAKSQI